MSKVVTVAALAALVGCAQLQSVASSPNVAACTVALVASGQRDVNGLLAVAQASPACQALQADLIQAAMREALLRVRQ